jgi:hypothetical protein
MLESRKTVDDMLVARKKETAEELAALRKKLKASVQLSLPRYCSLLLIVASIRKYLETEIAQSQAALREIFHQQRS